MNTQFLYALLLTTLAGLSTTIGSLISIVVREPGPRFMAFTLGFSSGVMIFVSFVELLQTGTETIGFNTSIFAFFCGILFMFIVDKFIPHNYMEEKDCSPETSRLRKISLYMALGIGIHNYPEGMATFAGTLKDVNIGIALAVAIAVHNIPEGIAVSVPVYAYSGSVKKSFLWSFFSGLSEPAGAIIAGVILLPFLNDMVLGYLLSGVAGLMIFISFDELLPVSHSYGKEHLSISGILAGMLVMAVSLGFAK